MYGSRSYASVSVDGANGDWWYLDFEPAAGDVLAPGTYTGATRYPFNGTGAGLSISGEGRGCNELSGSFTVNEFTTDRSALRTLSISFEQHCEHAAAALRGTFNFRAGDTTAPAPWMVASNTPVDIGTPPGNGTPAPPTTQGSAPAPQRAGAGVARLSRDPGTGRDDALGDRGRTQPRRSLDACAAESDRQAAPARRRQDPRGRRTALR